MTEARWERIVHAEPVWGTVVTLDIRGAQLDGPVVQRACRAASDELHRIDAWLSPFRPTSVVCALRNGWLDRTAVPGPVREVIAGCANATELTNGAFDPWAVPGGFDPCGYVKGWGADRAAEILVAHGLPNVSVNAAGDVTCRGRSNPATDGWRIGVADPRDRQRVIRTTLVKDAHLATSGRYEQGDHIVDPRTGRPATGVDSASVLAADGGLADALATGLLINGPAGLTALVGQPIWAYVVAGGHCWTTGTETTTGIPSTAGTHA
ncbi:MAG: FAD:protein FMN transferase [Actinomycetes bacterium]